MPKPTRFCHYCGHGPVDIDIVNCVCSDCHAIYTIPQVIRTPDLTAEEAEILFTKKELTDQQKYGTTHRGKYRRARRKKK